MGTTSDKTPSGTVLVLGGTGKTGSRVAGRLTTFGVPLRIGSRSGQPAFDWDIPATWQAAVQGIDAVYVAYQPDLAFPGAAETVEDFVRLAVKSGVRRLVLLSGRNEDGALGAEAAVQNSGVEWTIVRSATFMQNFSEGFMQEDVAAGELAFPAGDVAEPFIDVEDIAEVAVEALVSDKHLGKLYEVTGPRLLTFANAVKEMGDATGREISYVPVSPGQFTASLMEAGLPPGFASGLTELFTTIFDGRNASVTDGVQRALGRAPRDFAGYVRQAAAAGAWGQPAGV